MRTVLKSYDKKIIINDKADEVIEELFPSPLSWYQIGLVTFKALNFL